MKEYFTWLAKLLTLVVIFVIGVPFVIGALLSVSSFDTTKLVEGKLLPDHSSKKVAVVEITGVIQSSKELLDDLVKYMQKDDIIGVVLRIDSPGGAVGPAQEIYSAVKRFKEQKPIVASMGSIAASGGLYAALSASKIYAQPGTLTGSMGVILQVPNVSKITQKYDFEMVTIKSGELKDAGNMFREMTPADRNFLQDTVSTAQKDFVKAVAEGRGLSTEVINGFADGRVLLGSQAKEIGLIDEFGDVYLAARAVYALAEEPLADGEFPKLYRKKGKFDDLREVFQNVWSKFISPEAQGLTLQYIM